MSLCRVFAAYEPLRSLLRLSPSSTQDVVVSIRRLAESFITVSEPLSTSLCPPSSSLHLSFSPPATSMFIVLSHVFRFVPHGQSISFVSLSSDYVLDYASLCWKVVCWKCNSWTSRFFTLIFDFHCTWLGGPRP